MKKLLFILLLGFVACQSKPTVRTLNRTCVTTQHHELIIDDIDVYIKYDATDFNFPGWEDLAEYDTVFTTDAVGRGCMDNLPIGTHWFVGLGFDEDINFAVKGRALVDISFAEPEVDFILYVGEE
ncbi:MAG: hypothetical protein AAF960_12105 [Bacteroidota bacterium]